MKALLLCYGFWQFFCLTLCVLLFVAYNYCNMLWGIKYSAYRAPSQTAFLVTIPYAVGIIVCVVLAIFFKKKIG